MTTTTIPTIPTINLTYINDAGEEKRERRRKNRDDDDPRIGHLFNGFDNLIATAVERGNLYDKGYITAMRQEFGKLIASLVRG